MDHGPAQKAKIVWRGGSVPVSAQFDDPYFSLEGGLAETSHVFLRGNDLPQRFHPGFHIAELGFGTGLNALAAWDLWRKTGQPGQLRFTSFEKYPLSAEDLARSLAAWPTLRTLADSLVAEWKNGQFVLKTDNFWLQVIVGDARETLPLWRGDADAWFLDGFSPAKNPELWSAELLQQVSRHTKPGGSFATYTAAGNVRRALASAGFHVERTTGFGSKKHMSRGMLA